MHVKQERFAVTEDGMKMFGTFDIRSDLANIDLSIGIRNSHNKTMSLGMVAGYRVVVCSNMMFSGDFEPIFRKHTSGLYLRDVLIIGLEKMVKLIDPVRTSIQTMQDTFIHNAEAKEIILDALFKGVIPKHLLEPIYNYYFVPEQAYETPSEIEAFTGHTLWSMSNAFTSSIKMLNPIAQFQYTAKVAEYFKPIVEMSDTFGKNWKPVLK